MFNIFRKKTEKQSEEFIFKPENYKTVNAELAKTNNIFTLKENDHLIIQDYQQYNVNIGIIFGMPSDLTPYFQNSFKKAKEFFNEEFFIINPVLFTDKSSNNKDTYLLPQFLTMAIIDRTIPLEGEDYSCSALRVIWWQNTLGLPEPEILEKIKAIKWQKPYAYSWEF